MKTRMIIVMMGVIAALCGGAFLCQKSWGERTDRACTEGVAKDCSKECDKGCSKDCDKEGCKEKSKTKRGKMIQLERNNPDLTIEVGDVLSYTGLLHGSVGISYLVEYDHDAFKLESHVLYDRPQNTEPPLCGGDSAKETCDMEALKPGQYTIKILDMFRGEVEDETVFNVTVVAKP